MQGDKIRLLQQLLDAVCLAHAGGQPPGRIYGDFRVEAANCHAQLDGRVSHHAADGAEPDDAQRAARQLDARIAFLARLDPCLEVRCILGQCIDEANGRDHVASAEQQRRQHQFFHCIGVRPGRIEHGHASLRHLSHGDIVGSGARPANGLDGGRDCHVVHIVGTKQNGIRIIGFPADGVVRLRQARKPSIGNMVQREHLVFGHVRAASYPCSFSNSFMYSTSARTPSIGIAL